VPARNTPRGGARSRKRRRRSRPSAPDGPPRAEGPAGQTQAEQEGAAHARGERASASSRGTQRRQQAPRGARSRGVSESSLYAPGGVGERPRALWHPFPLSELLILVGAIGAAIGFSRHGSSGATLTLAGLAAVLLGTLEFTLREHLGGFRSHTIIIAVLAAAVFHSAIVLTVAAFTSTPRELNVALVLLDVGVFGVLFKLLRARFLDARRERVFEGRR
jgi:hypothetical protein